MQLRAKWRVLLDVAAAVASRCCVSALLWRRGLSAYAFILPGYLCSILGIMRQVVHSLRSLSPPGILTV
jgi:hypothetical protein